jgi:hypothetical protein
LKRPDSRIQQGRCIHLQSLGLGGWASWLQIGRRNQRSSLRKIWCSSQSTDLCHKPCNLCLNQRCQSCWIQSNHLGMTVGNEYLHHSRFHLYTWHRCQFCSLGSKSCLGNWSCCSTWLDSRNLVGRRTGVLSQLGTDNQRHKAPGSRNLLCSSNLRDRRYSRRGKSLLRMVGTCRLGKYWMVWSRKQCHSIYLSRKASGGSPQYRTGHRSSPQDIQYSLSKGSYLYLASNIQGGREWVQL